jgi:hypothetical protein
MVCTFHVAESGASSALKSKPQAQVCFLSLHGFSGRLALVGYDCQSRVMPDRLYCAWSTGYPAIRYAQRRLWCIPTIKAYDLLTLTSWSHPFFTWLRTKYPCSSLSRQNQPFVAHRPIPKPALCRIGNLKTIKHFESMVPLSSSPLPSINPKSGWKLLELSCSSLREGALCGMDRDLTELEIIHRFPKDTATWGAPWTTHCKTWLIKQRAVRGYLRKTHAPVGPQFGILKIALICKVA